MLFYYIFKIFSIVLQFSNFYRHLHYIWYNQKSKIQQKGVSDE